jgi:hypothetical protein
LRALVVATAQTGKPGDQQDRDDAEHDPLRATSAFLHAAPPSWGKKLMVFGRLGIEIRRSVGYTDDISEQMF